MQQQILNVILALHNGHAIIKIEQNAGLILDAHIFFTLLHENKLLSGEQIEDAEKNR